MDQGLSIIISPTAVEINVIFENIVDFFNYFEYICFRKRKEKYQSNMNKFLVNWQYQRQQLIHQVAIGKKKAILTATVKIISDYIGGKQAI